MGAGVAVSQDAGNGVEVYPRETIAWITVAILFLMSIVAFLDRQIVSLMVEMIKASFGVIDSQVALLQGAAFSLVYAAAAIPFGYAVDRWSRRATLFFGVFFWGLAACTCGLADSFNVLLAARIGVGFGEAALNPVVTSLLSDLFPRHRRALAFSVVSVGSLIGVNGALIIGGAVLHWAGDGMTLPVLGHLAPWKVAFLVAGLPGLLLAFTVFLIPEPRRRSPIRKGASSADLSTVAYIRENRRFLGCYMGGFTCLAIANYGLLSWTPAVLQRLYSWTAAEAGMVAGSLIAASGVAGTLTVGAVIDRAYARGRHDAHALVYVIAGLLLVASGSVCGFASSAWAFLLLILPVKFVSNFSGAALAGLSLACPDHLRGRVGALYSLVTVAVGAAIGPSSVAFFTDFVFRDESKVQWSIAVNMMLFGALGALLLQLARRPMRASAQAGSDRDPAPAAT